MLGWASDTRTQGASVWKPKGQPGVQGESAPGPALSPSASLCAVRPGSSLRTPGCLQVTRVFPLTLLSLVKRGRRSLTQTRGTWGFVALRAKGKHEARDAGSLLQAGFPAAVGSPYSANARTPRMYVTHSHLYTYTRMHTPPAHKHACVHTRVHSAHHPHTQTTHPHTSTHIHLCTAHCHIHAVTHGHTSMSTGTHTLVFIPEGGWAAVPYAEDTLEARPPQQMGLVLGVGGPAQLSFAVEGDAASWESSAFTFRSNCRTEKLRLV